MSVSDVMRPGEIPFEEALEMHSAAKRHASDLVEAANAQGFLLGAEAVDDAVVLAVATGYVPSAAVRLVEDRVVHVVDLGAFSASMRSFFEDAGSGKLPLPTGILSRGTADGTAGQAQVSPPGGIRARLAALTTKIRRRLVGRATALPVVQDLEDWRARRSPERLFEELPDRAFASAQKVPEISQLLRLMSTNRPGTVLEIGTCLGGTTYLLSRFAAPEAVLVTCDIALQVPRRSIERLARRRQRISVLELDSHSEAGERELRASVPHGVDLLFIDGDHSYEGVRQDFLTYADLVRPNGLFVFHDIVEDYRTRYGVPTNAWVGGVPRWWRELRATVPESFECHEFVADPDQDGFGIGVIQCPDRPSPGVELVQAYRSAQGHEAIPAS